MKLFLIVLMFAINAFAFDYVFLVEGYKKVPGMDYQMEYVVKNPKVDSKILLDCQSFISGLHYMNQENNKWNDLWFLVLEGGDCENIALFSRGSLDQLAPFCLRVDVNQRNLDFSSNMSDCHE